MPCWGCFRSFETVDLMLKGSFKVGRLLVVRMKGEIPFGLVVNRAEDINHFCIWGSVRIRVSSVDRCGWTIFGRRMRAQGGLRSCEDVHLFCLCVHLFVLGFWFRLQSYNCRTLT
jgi:hypothetical protein